MCFIKNTWKLISAFEPPQCLAPSIHCKCITVNVWFVYKPKDVEILAKSAALSHAVDKVILNQDDCFKFLCFPLSQGETLSIKLWWERLSLWCWAAADERKALLHYWLSQKKQCCVYAAWGSISFLSQEEGGGPSEQAALILHRKGFDCGFSNRNTGLLCATTRGKVKQQITRLPTHRHIKNSKRVSSLLLHFGLTFERTWELYLQNVYICSQRDSSFKNENEKHKTHIP